MIAVSEANCSFDISYTAGPSDWFLDVLERLAKVLYGHSHTASDLVSAAIGYS